MRIVLLLALSYEKTPDGEPASPQNVIVTVTEDSGGAGLGGNTSCSYRIDRQRIVTAEMQ